MKKLNLNQNYAFFNKAQKITSILLIFVSVMFIANSCTKEGELSKEDAMQLRTDLTPEQRVTAFTPIVNGTYDPTKTYTGAEAVLGVETVLNYEYGDFSKQFDETYSLKDTFAVNKQNGVITDQVVAAIYNQALQLMKCHYASILIANKVELLADLNLVSENSSQLQVGLNNVVGTASQILPNGVKSFIQGDNWKANFGKCNDPESPSNAPQQIAKYANWNLVGLYQQQAGVWYSDIEQIAYDAEDYITWFKKNPNDPIPGDYIIDSFMWWANFCDNNNDICSSDEVLINSNEYNDIICIDWPEMNYYLVNAENEAKKYEHILNKTFLSMKMDFWQIHSIPIEYYCMWLCDGNYGKKNVDHSRVILQLGSCN